MLLCCFTPEKSKKWCVRTKTNPQEDGENVTLLNTAQVFLFREDKSDMNMLRKKPSLFNSEIQQKLEFIIHFLQRQFVQFPQFFCFKIFPAALRTSFCHLFLAISWIRKIQFTIKVYNGLEIQGRFLQSFVVFQWVFFVPYRRLIVGKYEDTVSISHSHYTHLIHQAIYWISLGTKLILESYLTWWQLHSKIRCTLGPLRVALNYFSCLYELPHWLSISNRRGGGGLYLNSSHFSWWACLIDKNNLTRETGANK